MKDFFKKFKMPIIIGVVVLVIAIIIIFVLGGKKTESLEKIDKTQSVTKAYQLIAPEYSDIECVDDCKFFYAYKGEDGLTGIIDFFNETGKKLGSLNLSKMDPEMVAVFDIEDVTNNYYILSYLISDKESILNVDYKYVIYNMKNKVIMEVDAAEALTDKFIVAEQNDKTAIVDNTGKLIYENVSDVDVYNDKFITFEMNEVDKIIDENGEELLSGYTLSKVVLDENDEVDYLIVRSSEDSIYSYYNIKEKMKKGDSFTSYSEVDDEIVITKKVDSKSKKFVLNSTGEQVEYEEDEENVDKDAYYDEIVKKVDTAKYPIFKSTVNVENQNYILVDAKEENKFGILNVEKGEFKELASFKENSSRKLTLTKLSENEDIETDGDIIYLIKCSKYYCDNELHFVYNFSDNKLILSRDSSKESLMYSLKMYENGYYVVRNASSTYDDSSKYFLYDNEGKKLVESEYDINIIDSNVTYYTSSLKTTGQINLYSLSEKKVINLDEDEKIVNVTRQTFEEEDLYQFVLDNKTYLIAEDGTITKLDGELKYTDDVGMYLLDDDKIVYYNIFTKQTSSYELKDNESKVGSSGSELNPYRNAIFVNNTYDYIVKVIGVDGKVLLEKKNLQIYDIEKQSDGSILMLVKDKNDKMGMYIVR